MNPETRGSWTGYALPLAVTIFLGFRASSDMRAALVERSAPPAVSTSELWQELAQAESRASAVTAAQMNARDPFKDPVVRAPVAQLPRPQLPPPISPPQLILLVYDAIAPTVQLMCEGVTSNRLRVGDSFHGWLIVDIKESCATLRNGDTLRVLCTQ